MATADVLVTGATGNTGRPLVEELLARDAVVRAMVRSADAQVPGDPEKVVADFDDPGSLRSALEGVRRAYLVTPSSERAERQQLDFVDAARAAGVERLVVLSQLGSVADSPVRFLRYHAAVEQHVRDSGTGLHVPAAQPVLPGPVRGGRQHRRRTECSPPRSAMRASARSTSATSPPSPRRP